MIGLNTKDKMKDLKKIENLFDFSDLRENHQLFSNKNEKVIGEFKTETPKNISLDEFNCLRNKMYAYKCGDINKNKVKGFSKYQSKCIKSVEFKKYLDVRENQKEYDNYIVRSINREI